MIANKEMITWLLHDSGQSIAAIAKGSDMAWSTVADLKKNVSKVDKMSFENAAKLTKYAEQIK
ncbi:hypothetical protein FEZ48_02915 [Marinilactibacillus psychrotolerans]|uniref:Uncharacterized protein n=1 Tax=Marinilactibacillus psychrotolerans TaxID=191770 RepID=A0A5R9C6U4_9LACT|nr:hypothetical protein [Marinilactibacillus psychrotolerans]TLQ08853.1 hypothetical protein FEZ48_02915 [Marinilactibacillus psychrotolerans]